MSGRRSRDIVRVPLASNSQCVLLAGAVDDDMRSVSL